MPIINQTSNKMRKKNFRDEFLGKCEKIIGRYSLLPSLLSFLAKYLGVLGEIQVTRGKLSIDRQRGLLRRGTNAICIYWSYPDKTGEHCSHTYPPPPRTQPYTLLFINKFVLILRMNLRNQLSPCFQTFTNRMPNRQFHLHTT